jgi:hypothetical protein
VKIIIARDDGSVVANEDLSALAPDVIAYLADALVPDGPDRLALRGLSIKMMSEEAEGR